MEFSVDGKAVFAATGGPEFDPGLPTLIFVHGAGFDRTTWQLQTRYFAHRGFGVLAVDLPGHGRSTGPPIASIAELGRWLIAAMDAVGTPSASLVGHSMGALASLTSAASHPDRVDRLALLGVADSMPVHPELLAAAEANDQRAIDLMLGWAFGSRSHKGGHPSPGTWMMGTGNRQQQRASDGVLFGDLTACSRFTGGADLASQLRCPTLFLLGAADRMTPVASAQPLIDATDAATVVVLPDTGHMMPTERPGDVRDVLASFLA